MVITTQPKAAGKRYFSDAEEDAFVARISQSDNAEAERMTIALELGCHINTIRNIEKRHKQRREKGAGPDRPSTP